VEILFRSGPLSQPSHYDIEFYRLGLETQRASDDKGNCGETWESDVSHMTIAGDRTHRLECSRYNYVIVLILKGHLFVKKHEMSVKNERNDDGDRLSTTRDLL
jgi:hypothetical protein